jgi:hypothetical protein
MLCELERDAREHFEREIFAGHKGEHPLFTFCRDSAEKK